MRGRSAEPAPTPEERHQLAELLREVGVDHRRAFAGDKEGRPRRLRHEPIAQRRVRGEGIDCGRGEGKLSALVELRGPHDGHTVDPVDVGLHKRDGLAHAQVLYLTEIR